MADGKAVVGVVLGSDSDLETMQRCLDQLKNFGIEYELRVISAHRTPVAAHEYAATACDRGLKIIIAAAGMSAALAGVMAANTTLPVIGVPMSAGPLVGVDAALSTLQMPPGVPVAAMAIGAAGASNAAILAAEILALGDAALAGKLRQFKETQAAIVMQKDAALRPKP
ncbi:MAG: 5-(carboxyamino)imidazole ribonucleotide mutase [Phycisphaerae bacterium]|jgi:phosphoribosylaminoimidazole carboxylase PurE protein